MAKQPSKKSTTKKDTTSETTVTRIKATEEKSAVVTKKAPASTKSSTTKTKKTTKPITAEPLEGTGKRRNPFKALGGYFKGAWYELRQVRWPDRKATWSMTGALLAFTAFFVVIILLLDALFKYVFQLIIG